MHSNPDISILFAVLVISSLIHHITPSPLDNNEFIELIKQPYFVDKTELLVHFFKSDDHVFFALPRAFGKTTILKMIKAFSQAEYIPSSLEPKRRNDTRAYHIFTDFKIGSQSDDRIIVVHLNKYPVLYIDLKVNVTLNTSKDQIIHIFNRIFQPAYQEYSELLRRLILSEGFTPPEITAIWREKREFFQNALNATIFDFNQTVDNLRRFTNIMNIFLVKKPILLVDNYDYLAVEGLLNGASLLPGAQNGYRIFYEMANEAIRRAIPELHRIVFAGISGIISINDTSGLLVKKFSFTDDHKFPQYFGILEPELIHLLDNSNCTEIEKQKVLGYYKGYYMLGNRSVPIYNPYSVGKCLESKKPNKTIEVLNYWPTNELDRFLELALQKPSLREKINRMLDQGSIKVSSEKRGPTLLNEMIFESVWPNFDDDCLLQFFFELGYLTHGLELDTYDVVNAEVKQELKKIWAIKTEGIESTTGKYHWKSV